MTKEEAIKLIRKYECNKDHYEACEMAIKALESEDVFDKIRAEIEDLMPPLGNWMYEEGHIEEQTACEVIADVLHIINKYMVESEVKE